MTQAWISEKPRGHPRESLDTDPVGAEMNRGAGKYAEIGRWAGWEECQPLVVPGEPEAGLRGQGCVPSPGTRLLRISLKAAAVSAPTYK